MFELHKVVPDLIDTSPSDIVEVIFRQTNKIVNLGNELAPKDLKEIPHITYQADSDEYYTLIMTSPDAPRRKNPVQKEWQAWMVVNIPGSRVEEGEILAEYINPCPPIFTELHRFVFLVYKQDDKLDFNEPHKNNSFIGNRYSFSSKKFARKYRLGEPVAGNFFQAEYDDSVPECLRKLVFNRN